jgi:phosphoglycerate dehydrogenase-like enzyme
VHRAPNLIWAHFTFAGISNVKPSDWWGSPVMTTSSRGYTGARPIAETAVAGAMMLARRLDLAARNSTPAFDPNLVPDMIIIEGKTMGIVGLGGIGAQVAKMSKGLGMRVLATRHSARTRQKDVDGVDELFPVSETKEMLAECDFVAVCAIWTPETENMFNTETFAAMKPGAFLLNVARGELVDDDALIEALRSGHLGGAYLDVWPDDFARPPRRELLEMDNVIFTPHISGRGEVSHNFGFELFLENLGKLLRGEELTNVVDWERNY